MNLVQTHPDFNVVSVEEEIETSSMVEMQVPDDNLLDIFHLVSRSFNGSIELMGRFVSNSREDVGDLRSPDLGKRTKLVSISPSNGL